MDKLFENRATEYDVIRQVMPYLANLQECISKPVADYISRNPSQREFKIIEAGFGTLFTTEKILSADPRISIEAYDNSDKMFINAKEKLSTEKDIAPRVKLNKACIAQGLKSLKSNSFDGFVSALTLHHLTEEQRIVLFSQLSRVLKQGGFFINADKYCFDDMQKHDKNLQQRIKLFEKFTQLGFPHLQKEWTEHSMIDEQTLFTQSEQKRLFLEHGFSNGKKLFSENEYATIVSYRD